MSSNSKKTKRIRDRRTAPNKENQKKDRKRIQKNKELLRALATKEK